MFSDKHFVTTRAYQQERRYDEWLQFVQGSRVVIVELGCGVTVQTARRESLKISNFLGGAPIVRINLESADFSEMERSELRAFDKCIPIPLRALDALTLINAELHEIILTKYI